MYSFFFFYIFTSIKLLFLSLIFFSYYLFIRLNHSSTVLDLISLFNNQGAGTDSFTLSSGFPPKELTDPNQTLTEAGLISAAIQQKKV